MQPPMQLMSECGSESKRIHGFIDSILATRHLSRNKYDYLENKSNMNGDISQDCILLTLDVVGMHKNQSSKGDAL